MNEHVHPIFKTILDSFTRDDEDRKAEDRRQAALDDARFDRVTEAIRANGVECGDIDPTERWED